MSVNPDNVVRLMEAANEALAEESEVLDASGGDVMSAIFTLTKVAIKSAISLGGDPAEVRAAVMELLRECVGPNQQTH